MLEELMTFVKVYYLNHSGFAVETDTKVLIFDYYKDPEKVLPRLQAGEKPFWFFVSHSHADHFDPYIVNFSDVTARRITDATVPLSAWKDEKTVVLRPYEEWREDNVYVHEFGSTDEGGSFYVETDGLRIFHAGDLNHWHWEGDTEADRREADKLFAREMSRLDIGETDLAFFPVDARLGRTREWGVSAFLNQVKVDLCLIPMHYFGAVWDPSAEFTEKYGSTPLWIPQKDGDSRQW